MIAGEKMILVTLTNGLTFFAKENFETRNNVSVFISPCGLSYRTVRQHTSNIKSIEVYNND